jgi:hypothetical protein
MKFSLYVGKGTAIVSEIDSMMKIIIHDDIHLLNEQTLNQSYIFLS